MSRSQIACSSASSARSLRNELETRQPTMRRAYARVRPYQDLLDPQLRSWRLGATLFSIFGVLALRIASLGAFGVVSYLAAGRTTRDGARPATRWHWCDCRTRDCGGGCARRSVMLFETSSRDVSLAFAAVAILFGVAVFAAAIPAWRTSRLDPIIALRSE